MCNLVELYNLGLRAVFFRDQLNVLVLIRLFEIVVDENMGTRATLLQLFSLAHYFLHALNFRQLIFIGKAVF